MKREVTSIAQNTQVAAKQSPDYAGAIAPAVNKIQTAAAEAKIGKNLTEAQLEINEITNQYRVDNETNPMGKIDDYNSQVQDVMTRYGEDVNPRFKGAWANNANKVIGQTKLSNQSWGVKQNVSNATNDLEQTMTNKIQLAYRDGQNFSTAKDLDTDIVANYTESAQNLLDGTTEYLGEETAKELTQGYKEDYMASFISGVSELNPEMAKKFLNSDDVKNNLSEDSINNIRTKIDKAEKLVQKNQLEDYKNTTDTEFNANPYAFRTTANEMIKNGDEEMKENNWTRETYDKAKAYNSKKIEEYKKSSLTEFMVKPTQLGLDNIVRFDSSLGETQIEKLQDMVDSQADVKRNTSFRGESSMNRDLTKFANSPVHNTKDAKLSMDKAIDLAHKIGISNTGEGKGGATLSVEDAEKGKQAIQKTLADKLVRDTIAKMPDGTAFSRMFDRTLTDVDRSNDKRAGFSGIASDIAKSTFMIPRAIYDEIDRKKRIETIALETSIEMLDFGIAGDEDGMMKSYEKGKQKGIRAYYSHIPEMQGELVPNETYIPVNGKQYLFKGWGVDDVLLERAR